jgi:hypothetical protein
MESLALFATILLSFLVFSGPLALFITSRWAKQLSESKYVLVLRRSFLAAINILGMFISLSIIVVTVPIGVKFLAVISILLHVLSVNREYQFFSHKLSRDPNGPGGQD